MNKTTFIFYARKAALFWLGTISILFGVLSSIIPFVPGFVFVILGIILISRSSRRIQRHSLFKRLRKEIKKRFMEKKDNIIEKYFGKFD